MDQIARKDAHELREHVQISRVRLRRVELGVDQTRRRLPVEATHQLHEQDAFQKHHWFGHPHTSRVQFVQRGRFLGLPRVLGGLLTELGAAIHGPLRARIPDRPAFFVSRIALEAALSSVFVDLGGDDFIAVGDREDLGLLATLQTTVDLTDDAFGEERFETACHDDCLGKCRCPWAPASARQPRIARPLRERVQRWPLRPNVRLVHS